MALLGLGPRSESWTSLLGMVGPRLSVLVFGLSFFGWELVLSFWWEFWPFLRIGLPSRDGELALLSGVGFFSSVVGGPLPSCCQRSPFHLGVGVGPSR